MNNLPKALRAIRGLHEDDTGLEIRLVDGVQRLQHCIDAAFADGIVQLHEEHAIRRLAERCVAAAQVSLNNNRVINALYCAGAGGMDPARPETQVHLPALRLIVTEPEQSIA